MTGRNSKRDAVKAAKPQVVCALDVGSSKVCAVIARLTPRTDGTLLPGRRNAIEVMGFGHVRSGGIKSGIVTDMDAAENAIRIAIDTAERTAGVTIDSLTVGINAGRIGSDTFSSSITIDGDVAKRDIRTLLAAGLDHAARPDRTALHALPIGYSLDGEHGIDNPVSMSGRELGVDMHVVSVDNAPVANIEACINRSHLSVDGLVAAPYASGLAALVDDEARLGCAAIDFGHGTTSVAIFMNNRLVFADAIAVGGNHVTMDLARGLGISMADAERLKVLHATVDEAGASQEDTVSVVTIGDDALAHPKAVTLGQIAAIAAPRVEETIELIRDRIARSGFGGAIGKRLVLTGGASQLSGLPDLAARIFNADVRQGRPLGVSGLPANAKGGAFSTVAGLLVYRQVADDDLAGQRSSFTNTFNAFGLGRVGAWLRASL